MHPPPELVKGQKLVWLGEPVLPLHRARMWRHWHSLAFMAILITICSLPVLLDFSSVFLHKTHVLDTMLVLSAWLCVGVVFYGMKSGGVDQYAAWYALTDETFLIVIDVDGGNELFTYRLSDLACVRLNSGRDSLTCRFRSSPHGRPRRVIVQDVADLPTMEVLLKSSCRMY